MSVIDALSRHDALSFEVFPPRTDAGMEKLCGSVLPQLYSLRPDAVSCTYSAGGADVGKNLEILGRVAKDGRCLPATHFTCISARLLAIDSPSP